MSIWIQVDNKEHVASGMDNATKSPRALGIMMKPWIKPFLCTQQHQIYSRQSPFFPCSNDFKGFTLYCLIIYSNCNELLYCMNERTIYSISTIQLTNSNTIAIYKQILWKSQCLKICTISYSALRNRHCVKFMKK